MENKILQSIVEITRHRDLDSLEYAFVATLHELLDVNRIALYRLIKEDRIDRVDEIVCLNIDPAAKGQKRFTWNKEIRTVEPEGQLAFCLESRAQVSSALDSAGIRYAIPIEASGQLLGAVVLDAAESVESLELVEALVKIYGNYKIILHESEHDKLTGLLNRRAFETKLNRLLKAQRLGNEYADAEPALHVVPKGDDQSHPWLAVVDVDHFKRVNDSFGHVYGDEILLLLSQQMKGYFGKRDLLFRVGGEEFLVILAPVSAEQAHAKLDGFRSTIANHAFPQVGTVTVSIGYAKIRPGDYPRRIFDLADKALYVAKAQGRNRIFNYESLVEEGQLSDEDRSGSIELF
ncbi:MAG: GGDEF domain-containing protein [Xanthomonadales bacterium]|nr:GGDEF domain-containing protein [Xanthomonadales bacterium]